MTRLTAIVTVLVSSMLSGCSEKLEMETKSQEQRLLAKIQDTPAGPERDSLIDQLEDAPVHYRMVHETPFVVNGCEIAHCALRPEVTKQVHVDYRDQLANATSWWQRLNINRRIAREIEQRIDAKAPPDALY